MRLIYSTLIAAIFCLLQSCEKAAMPRNYKESPRDIFEQLWTGIDHTYSLFELTDLDWNAIKDEYSTYIYDSMSDEQLYSVLADMIAELKDGHSNLYPGADGTIPKKIFNFTAGYTPNYKRYTVEEFYLKVNNMVTIHPNFRYCILPENIGYMSFDGYFRKETKESDFIAMLEYFSGTKGLILDIRNNGGGESALMRNMLSHFTDSRIHVGKVKYKTGSGHNDFTNWYDTYHNPRKPYFSKPVMLLVNRGVYSAANDMAQFALSYPNITVVGAQTGGGIGIPVRKFLANGWFYRTSTSVNCLSDGRIFINGITPDVEAVANLDFDCDGIIDKAVSLILARHPLSIE